jgi:hypothetical protein
MSDLIERLRDLKAFAPNECRAVIDEAADEIERLEAALRHCAVARLCTSCEAALDSGGE